MGTKLDRVRQRERKDERLSPENPEPLTKKEMEK
jgi:hypothetical protein